MNYHRLLKRRIYDNINHVYIADKKLRDTDFKPQKHYRTMIDVQMKRIVFIPTDNENENTVSVKRHADGITPLLDLRDKEKLGVFKGSEYLTVEIFEDQVIVEGYMKPSDIKVASINDVSEQFDVLSKIKAVKIARVVMSKTALLKASGFDSSQLYETVDIGYEPINGNNVIDMRTAVDNLKVTMSVLDLFSGAGLLSKAFLDAGFKIIKAYDKEADCEGAIETYKYNIGKHIEKKDILELELSEVPEADGLIAGVPCDQYTTLNSRTNIRNELGNGLKLIDCPAFRLMKKTLSIIKAKVKSWFFLEEVVDILSVANGGVIDIIKNFLPGFKLFKFVVNASDYGTAQNRKRAFIIGTKIGDFIKPIETCGERPKTVGEALKDLSPKTSNFDDYSKPRASTVERMRHIPQGGNWQYLPEHLRTKGCFGNYYHRLDSKKPSVVIANVRKAILIHPTLNRTLSVRECARLMGLNDDFKFFGPLSSMQQQVTQGVCYEPAKAFADAVRGMIERWNTKYAVITY